MARFNVFTGHPAFLTKGNNGNIIRDSDVDRGGLSNQGDGELMIKATLYCDKHPSYKAKRKPKKCPACWYIYAITTGNEVELSHFWNVNGVSASIRAKL